MESYINGLIIFHAIAGGIALVSGLLSMIAKKGHRLHKKSGIVFYYNMLIVAASAMVVSLLPGHESPFFFAIGIFSGYLALSGYRAIRFKKKVENFKTDRWISGIMAVSGALMIIAPPIISGSFNIILAVFGATGLFFAIRDLQLFRNPSKLRKQWQQMHLGKMSGAYIAAVTAFVVVNDTLPGLYAWFVPGVLGSVYITYWTRKVSRTVKRKILPLK